MSPKRKQPLHHLESAWHVRPCGLACSRVAATVRRKGLSETDARWYFKQLILALDYCHKMVCMCPGWWWLLTCRLYVLLDEVIASLPASCITARTFHCVTCSWCCDEVVSAPGRVQPRHQTGEYAAGSAAGQPPPHAEAVRCVPSIQHAFSAAYQFLSAAACLGQRYQVMSSMDNTHDL